MYAKGRGRPDTFYTPPEALDPLLPFLPPRANIWEPCSGKDTLARALAQHGHTVFATDVTAGIDLLTADPPGGVDLVVTNPPYSRKDDVRARCYALRLPFALLLPLTALEGYRRKALYRAHGLHLILLPRRVAFETPSGGPSSPWFPVGWFTWGLRYPAAVANIHL